MGDTAVSTEGGFQPSEPPRAGLPPSENANKPTPSALEGAQGADGRFHGSDAPFYSQYSAILPAQQRLDTLHSPGQQLHGSYSLPLGHNHVSSFSMGAIAGALPDSQSPPVQSFPHQQLPQRGLSGASTLALVYQLQQISQHPGQAAAGFTGQSPVNPAYYQTQHQAPLLPHGTHPGVLVYGQAPPPAVGLGPPQQAYPSFQPQPTPPYVYYSAPYCLQGQFGQLLPMQATAPVGAYGRRSSLPASLVTPPGADTSVPGGSLPPSRGVSGLSDPGAAGQAGGAGPSQGMYGNCGRPSALSNSSIPESVPRAGSETGFSTLPRGPPRKPRQSGHALWVGNLPPGTTVTDLKDHFSREATKDIESLFLISKSNCAFVNYRTEASCMAAMHRFHDSRFNGVRLVCRLRRSSVLSPGVPSGPSRIPPRAQSTSPPRAEGEGGFAETEKTPEQAADGGPGGEPRVPEKFFIVKSLTLQDLELSARNGIWATQAHNEEALNRAYQMAENVYLIFSANKSGEYFGYARMASPISDDPTEIMSTIPKAHNTDAADGPRSILTPATQWAPKGRIIDDLVRGTIFWEAEHSDVEEDSRSDEGHQPAGDDTASAAQTWGKPFKVEWMSTNRLPFYRTRGLRNPWNANREVKIARDGTELETSVGKRLIHMFHRLGPSNVGISGPGAQQQAQPPVGMGLSLLGPLQRQAYS